MDRTSRPDNAINPYSAPRALDEGVSFASPVQRRTWWHWYFLVHFTVVLMSVPLRFLDEAGSVSQIWEVLFWRAGAFCAMLFAGVGPFLSLWLIVASVRRRSSALGFLAIADVILTLVHYPILLPLVR